MSSTYKSTENGKPAWGSNNTFEATIHLYRPGLLRKNQRQTVQRHIHMSNPTCSPYRGGKRLFLHSSGAKQRRTAWTLLIFAFLSLHFRAVLINSHKVLALWIFNAHFVQTREDVPSCGSTTTPRCVFKRSARGMLTTPALWGILNKFSVEMYFFFLPAKSPTEILKLMLQTRHVSEISASLLFLESEKHFCVALPFKAILQLYCTRFHDYFRSKTFHNCTLFRNFTVTRNQYHVSPIWHVFLHRRRFLIDLIRSN